MTPNERAAERVEKLNHILDACAVPRTQYCTDADTAPEWLEIDPCLCE